MRKKLLRIRKLIKLHLWIIGLLSVIAGSSLIGLFILSSEGLIFFGDLNLYTPGFFIAGLIALVFGILVSIIPSYASEEEKNSKIKIRIVLTSAAVLFLVLIVYLLAVTHEWRITAWVVKIQGEEFKISHKFAFTDSTAYFATLFSFGIFVLPFVIDESGILGNYPDEPPDTDGDGD